MKGNGLLIFAVIAVVAGASSAIFLSQTITEKNSEIESKDKKITELTEVKNVLETKTNQLSQAL